MNAYLLCELWELQNGSIKVEIYDYSKGSEWFLHQNKIWLKYHGI